MIDADNFVVSPIETPGLVHVPSLTTESARATEDLLKDNNQKYHIFFTLEDHMGVSLVVLLFISDGQTSYVLDTKAHKTARFTYTIISPTMSSLCGRVAPRQSNFADTMSAMHFTCAMPPSSLSLSC